MKRSIGAVAGLVAVLTLGMAAVSGAREAPDADRAAFVGNWELVDYVSIRENGEVVDMNYVGRILYDEAGNMSAIGMPRDLPGRPRSESGAPPVAGFAYFSTFTVDPAGRRVIHHVSGSPTHPHWVGTDLVRHYEFSGDHLLLSVRNDQGRVTGTLTWRKLK
jgi:hypothetical protein